VQPRANREADGGDRSVALAGLDQQLRALAAAQSKERRGT